MFEGETRRTREPPLIGRQELLFSKRESSNCLTAQENQKWNVSSKKSAKKQPLPPPFDEFAKLTEQLGKLEGRRFERNLDKDF